MKYTPVDQISSIVEEVRNNSKSKISHSLEWRKTQLRQLKKLVEENEQQIKEALQKDLKSDLILSKAEIFMTAQEIDKILNEIDDWIKPEKKSVPLTQAPGSAVVIKEPVGVVLIISPWNYPISLINRPLIGAIGAGNCVVVKPSEVSENCARLIAELFPKYLDQRCIRVISGGPNETTELLKQRFDHIFYTGNGTVGRIVMRAAAEHLTPVTLELGGKSPCIIDRDVDLKAAVPRIVWGKFNNCGQTCIAPDYVLVHRDRYDEFLQEAEKSIKRFYGENPKESADWGKIINSRHTQRLSKLLEGQTIAYGGDVDVDKAYLAPTIVAKPDPNSALMKDEIFGPIMPVLTIDSLDDAVQFIEQRDKPLALYVFSNNRAAAEKVLKNTSFGGGAMNETLMHNLCRELPFGGIGESGMGAYNGTLSLDTFTHRKGVLLKGLGFDPDIRYPPYNVNKVTWFVRLARLELPSVNTLVKYVSPVVVASAIYWAHQSGHLSKL